MLRLFGSSYLLFLLAVTSQPSPIDGHHIQSQLLDCGLVNDKSIGSRPACSQVTDSRLNASVQPTSRARQNSEVDVFKIDFNNAIRRRRNVSQQSDCSNSTELGQALDVICLPRANYTPSPLDAQQAKQIELTFVPSNEDQSDPETPSSRLIDLGTTNIVQCRFKLMQSITPADELKFSLRWLRSVVGSQGYQNQSISTDEGRPGGQQSINISAESKRSWTVQRKDGLDLFISDFKPNDEGDYFCQALLRPDTSSPATILDEKRIQLTVRTAGAIEQPEGPDDGTGVYSQDNLAGLLPSLQVIPAYREVAPGDTVQLACVTKNLDPDPSGELIEWTFEPFERPGFKALGARSFIHVGPKSLPANSTQMGNMLVVWSMSLESVGIYKCTVRLHDFNLTAQASGELMLRPSGDSAPLIYIAPELLRLSANGSAAIQCESTGYPPPKLHWYRMEVPSSGGVRNESGESGTNGSDISRVAGIELRQLDSRDAMAYCEQMGCLAINNQRLQGKSGDDRLLITGLSIVTFQQARAEHQGQYVCVASNKHGQNQASALVDVEFKEAPRVRIDDQFRLQTIVLEPVNFGQLSASRNVTFKCTIEAGQPMPRLKWLRATASNGLTAPAAAHLDESAGGDRKVSQLRAGELEIYDLTRVSSATSKVSTRYEDNGRTLALLLSTISIDDEGEYICVADNGMGRHSATARLLVRVPAQVSILQASPRLFRPNESFQLDCLASGYPAPLDIEWSRSDRGAFFALITRQTGAPGSHQTIGGGGGGGGNAGSARQQQLEERAVLKFERASSDDAGEYTCAARDPLDSAVVLRDTIMLVMEEEQQQSGESVANSSKLLAQKRLPKLLIRPTKVSAQLGANITLDCLAISGLQPTLVEWLPPASLTSVVANSSVKPFYRSDATLAPGQGLSWQFGSRLRIFNVSKADEGVYQCKGRNKVGVENAPALVKVLEADSRPDRPAAAAELHQTEPANDEAQTKTKIATASSNIELRCQVNGMVEQPATSWSREGRELPASSVQIGHNLWIQNLTQADEGLYLCSARSSEPNRIIQAKINLLVRSGPTTGSWFGLHTRPKSSFDPASLSAKVVASKANLNLGDSVTLECIIAPVGGANESQSRSTPADLDELERQVIWTNSHSGHSLFQDNVYIQENLLIIYDLKQENLATYRCHYNDLLQHTDYKLQLAGAQVDERGVADHQAPETGGLPDVRELLNLDQAASKVLKLPAGARLQLNCSTSADPDVARYFWTRGNGAKLTASGQVRHRQRIGRDSQPLVFESVETSDADLYQCNRVWVSRKSAAISDFFLVQVELVAAKFTQRPVSFIGLPAVSDANHQLELEMKFFVEAEHGLMLFSGSQQQAGGAGSQQTDFISLGLHAGHLEFRFELGDGMTMVRSPQALSLNQWHRVVIERLRRSATMWLDGEAPVSNSSSGKFFNLNLDSFLYVGGHQAFLSLSTLNRTNKLQQRLAQHAGPSTQSSPTSGQQEQLTFHTYAQGFRGCISSLKINGRELELMARNRSVALGIFECDQPECGDRHTICASNQRAACQVDRSDALRGPLNVTSGDRQQALRRRSMWSADLRCICRPPAYGSSCNGTLDAGQAASFLELAEKPSAATANQVHSTNMTAWSSSSTSSCSSQANPANASCNSTGTSQCQSISSSSFRCHCKLGFGGKLCDQPVAFANNTSVWFNGQAHLQFAFNSPSQALKALQLVDLSNQQQQLGSGFNETQFAQLTSFTDQLNVSFSIQTRSSYGLLFYTGQAASFTAPDVAGSLALNTTADGQPQQRRQVSKSVAANLLARLSSSSSARVADYLALALVDGHAELSFELGSGVAVLRSTRRINDGLWHKLAAFRTGRQASLVLDEAHIYEGQSPGRLFALNSPADIYLGGLPSLHQQPGGWASAAGTSGQLLASFQGCLAEVQINSLGPLDLVHSDHLTQLKSARNLLPCRGQQGLAGDTIAGSPSTASPSLLTTRRPAKAPSSPESDSDDPDEFRVSR